MTWRDVMRREEFRESGDLVSLYAGMAVGSKPLNV
jgi:hypothetical protein